jgi:hypothetical protein
MNLNIILIILILIIFYIFYIKNNNLTEFFNQDKNIQEIANDKIDLVKNINLITLNKISKYFSDISYNLYDTIDIKPNKKILVSIASYRDSQCSITLLDVITKAKNPENLVVIVCQQNESSDTNCVIDKILNNTKATIKQIKISHTEAKGPCWARFLIQQLWTGEEYYLQVDSHTRFVEGWDEKCIDCLNKINDKKACLTNYVSTFNINTGEIEINPLRGQMYIESIDQNDGFFRYNSQYEKMLLEPKESKGWSGCFSFSSSQIIIDAPYDPYTPFLFFGEEMDIFARLYTRGWKMYIPHIPICFTIFDRSYRKTFWEHPDQAEIVQYSKIRLYLRFGILDKDFIKYTPDIIKKDLEYFSLGNVKTFTQFLEYCNK